MGGVVAGGMKRTPWLLAITLVVVFVITWFSLEAPMMPDNMRRYRPSAQLQAYEEQQVKYTFTKLLQMVYQPHTAIDATTFRDYAGTEWKTHWPASWKKPLGKRFCIVDIDTRPLDRETEVLNKNPLNWDTTNPLTAGMLNHYMYALIHGYDYHVIQIDKLPDRAVYWSKPMALSRVLKNYDVCLSIDADAIFTHLSLPFEWLLNRWHFQRGETGIMMPLDPDAPQNYDSKGRLNTNAGFVVAQNIPRTHDMLRAWATCPDDEQRFPGCSKWKEPWPAEQRAWADYIRYEYTNATDILEIPCSEANGFPEDVSDCKGDFVRHYWNTKGTLLKPGVAASLAQAVIGRAHDNLLSNEGDIIVKDRP